MEIGRWLKINGEAIYSTRAYIKTKKDAEINPETNKTIFFTQKDKDVYMICLGWPKGKIELKGMDLTNKKIEAQLLGTDSPISVKKARGILFLKPPVLTPDDYQLAYVFKVTGLIK